jgi:putative ABC transport system permease protein
MISLSYYDLAGLSVMILLLGLLLLLNGFEQTRQLWVASARMVVQLLLMGVWLSWVFNADSWVLVALVSVVMLLFAGYEILKRQTYRFQINGLVSGSFVVGLLSLSMTALVLTIFSLTLVIQPQPWYEAQYAIPLLGMILGNSMTAIGLGLDTLTKSAVKQKAQIEAQLALGYTAKEALMFLKKQSLHTAMIPVINMLAAAGIVSLPGMMTGQILAGIDPMEAVKYQIMIMFLITVSTASGVLIALWLAQKKLFDPRMRLNLSQLVKS